MTDRAQAIVEFALVMPIFLFTMLAFIEGGLLLISKAEQDRSTAVVAAWAASHHEEAWNAVAEHELHGCEVTVHDEPLGLVTAISTCLYQPKVTRGFWTGLRVSSSESAVIEPNASFEVVAP